jgi:hypothetical protein
MLRFFVAAMLLVVVSNGVTAGTIYEYANTTGFTVGAFPSGSTPTSFAFPASGGPIAMTRTSTSGTDLTLTTRTVTYSSASPYSNPDWIAGTRSFFGIADGGAGPGHTISFTSVFSSPLLSTSYLVFTDVEFGESIAIKAYNNASLIPFADLTFTKWNGRDPNGTTVNTTWSTSAGDTGILVSGTPYGFSNPVVTLQSSQPISSLEYTINMGSATNSLGFNFVVPTSSVPEVDPAGMGSVLALLTGTLGLLERRRLKAS